MKPMRFRGRRPAVLACAAWLACAGAAAEPRTTLRVMPGSSPAQVQGLGDGGLVVGSQTVAGGSAQPFVWRPELSGPIPAPQLLGQPGSAQGVNASGLVVGASLFDGVGVRAFAWTAGGGLQNLGTLPGGGLSFATGVDAAGRIVGQSQVAGGASHAFLLDLGQPNATMVDLGTLGGTSSNARGIASGIVVGASTDAGGSLQAFRWAAAGGMVGAGPIGSVSEALAVNAGGLAVGRAVVAGSDMAFLWAAGGRAQVLTGSEGFHGVAVNDAGQVLLRHGGGGSSMLWVAGGTPTKLHTLAGAGISNFDATSINSYAQVAGVATGTATGGVARPVLLTLHPDWQGGSGRWDGADGLHWNWAGTGLAAATVGAMHDVVIDPEVDATVTVGAAVARSLRVGGRGTQAVTLQMTGDRVVLADRVRGDQATITAGGTLQGQGTLTATHIVVEPGGQVLVQGEMTLDASGSNIAMRNQGLLRVGAASDGTRGLLDLPHGIDNQVGGHVEVLAGDVRVDGESVNRGVWEWSGDTRLIPGNGVVMGGGNLYNLDGGRMVFGAGRHEMRSGSWGNNNFDNKRARVELAAGATVVLERVLVSSGELDVAEGALLGLHRISYLGGASGGGRIEVHDQLRTMAPGGGVIGNLVRIAPALTLQPGGMLAIIADSVKPGAGLDKFIFERPVTLAGGGLSLIGYAGYRFGAGEVYDLFDWNGGVSGSFTSLLLPTLADGLAWDTTDLYAGGTLSTTAVPEPGPAALLLAGLATLGWHRQRRAPPRGDDA